MLASRGGKTKEAAKHSVTTKTGFVKEYLTKYQTNENIQPTRVLCYMVNHENGVSPYPSHCHAWSPRSHKILLGHLPHPIPEWPLYQVQDEMLEIRCRERNFRSSFLCMPDRGCELHTFLWTAHAWAVSARAGFSLYRSNSRHLGSAGSAQVLHFAAQTQKQLDIWQMNKRHDINSNETYLWTQDVDFRHKHMENHSWP